MKTTPYLDLGTPYEHSRQLLDGRWVLTLSREFPHPVAKVWRALTEPDQLPVWSPYTADRSLAAVGPATLTGVDGMSADVIDGEVLSAEPPTLLEHRWGPDETLRWELDETPAGTRLTLHHTLAGRDEAAMMAAGWHLCLAAAAAQLDGKALGKVTGHDAPDWGWEQLHELYRRDLDGPTAAS